MTGLQELPTDPEPSESGTSEEEVVQLISRGLGASAGWCRGAQWLYCLQKNEVPGCVLRSRNLFLSLLFLHVPSSTLAPELVVQVWQVAQMAWYFIGPIKPVSKRCLFSDINTDWCFFSLTSIPYHPKSPGFISFWRVPGLRLLPLI